MTAPGAHIVTKNDVKTYTQQPPAGWTGEYQAYRNGDMTFRQLLELQGRQVQESFVERVLRQLRLGCFPRTGE